jgi:hypothetical protein
MPDFDDLALQRSRGEEGPPPPPPRPPLLLPAILIVVVLAAIGAWYWLRAPREIAANRPSSASAVPAQGTQRKPEPGDSIPLPPLAETDALVRELVSALSAHPRVAAWLTTDGLIRNFTVSVENMANGRTPSRHLKAVAPPGAFQVATDAGGAAIDPRSYRRYDSHADAVGALDARGAARLYATLKPRIDDAYRELGAGDSFDGTLERALISLLATPIVEGQVPLEAAGATYRFADPALESLTPAQRQFLRMGPRNMRIVQAKLRDIARYLDIPAASLPPERVYRP